MLTRYIADSRRNHALEHATVQLLLARLGPELRLVGRASADGFFLYGSLPSEMVAECAREGLRRLQAGEGYWAVTSLCGTNIATSGILASLAAMAMLGNGRRKEKMGGAMAAGIIAATIAQPLGRVIQRHLTTSPDLADTEIVSIESREDGRFHKVRTRRLAA